MDPVHRKTLQKLRAELKKNLEVESLWDELLARGVFSEEMVEEFKSGPSPARQRDSLLTNLPKRGPRAYELFLECLDETEQSHIKEMILKKERELRGVAEPPSPADGRDTIDFVSTAGILDLNVVKSSKDFIEHFDKSVPFYRMSSTPRGYALLINNRRFNYLSERMGTETDGTNLQNLLQQLGYQVEQKMNLTANEIKTAVRQFSVKPQHNQVDSCIFAIMTHGENGEVYGVDDELVPLDNIVALFQANHCPALHDKPKIFLIQACRGSKKDTGAVDMTDSAPEGETPGLDENMITQFQKMSINDAEVLKQKLPSLSDTVIAYSTIPGFVSWRDTAKGSWFIQSICQTFAEHAHKEHFLDLLTMVNYKMSLSFGTQYKQTPAPVFTIKKKLFFFPGL